MSSLEEMFFLKTKLRQKGGLVSLHVSFVPSGNTEGGKAQTEQATLEESVRPVTWSGKQHKLPATSTELGSENTS